MSVNLVPKEERRQWPGEPITVVARCALWENWPDPPSEEVPYLCVEPATWVQHYPRGERGEEGCEHILLCEDHAGQVRIYVRAQAERDGHLSCAEGIDRTFEPLTVDQRLLDVMRERG